MPQRPAVTEQAPPQDSADPALELAAAHILNSPRPTASTEAPSKPEAGDFTNTAGAPPAQESATLSASPQQATDDREAYLRELMSALLRQRNYPDSARRQKLQGIAQVRFSVDRNGRVLQAQLRNSSGHPLLDAAALELLRLASLPPMPSSMPRQSLSITVPIEFSLNSP